jgi:hypothetical protein
MVHIWAKFEGQAMFYQSYVEIECKNLHFQRLFGSERVKYEINTPEKAFRENSPPFVDCTSIIHLNYQERRNYI